MALLRTISLSLLLASLVGCTKYDFIILDPPELSQTIGRDEDVVFSSPSVEYRMRAAGDRLVIQILNAGETPIRLDAARSVVVAPNGETHPITGQTIAAGGTIKLILPPYRPVTSDEVYNYGFGYGYGYRGEMYPEHRRNWDDRGDRYRHGPYRPRFRADYFHSGFYFPAPPYVTFDDASPIYWDWLGETQIQLTLAYDRDGAMSEDRFVIQRQKSD